MSPPENRSYPRITIVTASYNQGAFLDQALASIHDQNYPNLEHIVIDGGSTDKSVEIIERYAPRLAYWHTRRDDGQSHAINAGFQRATGDIFAWVNSSDCLAPGALFTMARTFADVKQAAWAVGDCLWIDEAGNEVGRWTPGQITLPRVIDWGRNYINQPAVFWTRTLWERSGVLDESLHYAMDFDLWLEFFRHAEPRIVGSAIGVNRRHGCSKTSTVGVPMFDEYKIAIGKRLHGRLRRHATYAVARQAVDRANAAFFLRDDVECARCLAYAIRTTPRALLDPRFAAVLLKRTAGRRVVERWWALRARIAADV
jgi:glycosyltransferase involved in cell wall biosynthesis